MAALIGAAAFLVALPLVRPTLDAASKLPWLVLGATTLLLLLPLAYGTVRRRLCNPRRLENLGAYPPLFGGALLGATLSLLAVATLPGVRSYAGLGTSGWGHAWRWSIAATIVLVAVGAVLVATAFAPRRGKIDVVTPEPHTRAPNEENLVDWLRSDAPVSLAREDLFGHAVLARRIAARLNAGTTSSQAVVGPLGSGKTTLRHLVAEELRHLDADVVVVPVELWPYENPRAAVEGIIHALIEALAVEVNTIALRGLPMRYTAAMSAVGGAAAVVAELTRTSAAPFEVLTQINTVACAIDRTYVLWIEDLERFAPGESDSAEEKVAPIRAVLFGLDQLPSVKVITATTSLKLRFDIEKIARYVEIIPPLHDRRTAALVALLRTRMLHTPGIVDAATRHDNDGLGRLGVVGLGEMREWFPDGSVTTVAQALLIVGSNPRALKQGLRRASETWDAMPGEVDVDDLLVMSILREAEPDAFAGISEQIALLRWRDVPSSVRSKEVVRSRAAAIDQIRKSVTSPERQRAVARLVEFVFGDRSRARPQGFGHRGHRDYWERFLSVPTITTADSDQHVLAAIGRGEEAVLALLDDQAFHGALIAFAPSRLDAETVRGLLPGLVERLVRREETTSNEAPLVAIRLIWERRHGWFADADAGVHADSVTTCIQRALDCAILAHRFGLAVELENLFLIDGDAPWLGNNRAAAVDALCRHTRDRISGVVHDDVDALVEGLRFAPLPTLLWLCWGLDGVRAERNARTAELPDFWLANRSLVIAALEKVPRTVAPAVACMCTRDAPTLSGPRVYDREELVALFGDDAPRVEGIFAALRAEDWTADPRVGAIIAAVQPTKQ